MKRSNQKGITLIALVITIIVLLILASVSIATLTRQNGMITKSNEAKEETEIASLIEEVELARLAMITENNGDTTKRASELMYYLVDNGVLKEDRLTFKSNEKYSLYTNGNIMRDGEKVANVKMTEKIEEHEGLVLDSETTGQFMGKGYIYMMVTYQKII